MGRVAEALTYKNASPKVLSIEELALFISDKTIVFYTGAGISTETVPTMPQLIKALDLNSTGRNGVNLKEFVRRALASPDTFSKPMTAFYEACLYGAPTAAHQAIKDIIKIRNWGILTENLDLLHHRTGIKPLAHNGPNWLTDFVSPEDLKKIQVIITVGLSGDESGFLAWYKQNNPEGIIVAVNINQPSYLSDKDFLIVQDAQKALPALAKLLR